MKTLLLTAFFLLTSRLSTGQDTTGTSNGYDAPRTVVDKLTFTDYPKLPTTPQSLKYFIPAGWNVLDSVRGDLDGDRVPDLCIVLQYRDRATDSRRERREWTETPRILLLLFKDKTKSLYRLALQNNHIIPRAGEGKQGSDPFDGLKLKNRVLTLDGTMGGEYDFRFRNGDFYLVSAWTNGIRGGVGSGDGTFRDPTFYYYRIDFLKSKVTIRTSRMDGEEEAKEKEVSIAQRRLLRLKDLKEFDERKIFRGFIK
jgi:hypothetical protein